MDVDGDLAAAVILWGVIDHDPSWLPEQPAVLLRPEEGFICELPGHSDDVE